jgi:NAD-dependent deacetylase
MAEREELEGLIAWAAKRIAASRRVVALTGAGISTESGIPAFRGPEGLWSRYDPSLLQISFFRHFPERSWPVLKEIFFTHLLAAGPNPGHFALARMQQGGALKTLITQNIDGLHQQAGSSGVIEYHGSARALRCLRCGRRRAVTPRALAPEVPLCRCGGLLKPDFVLFGQGIPPRAAKSAERAARLAEVMLIVGTTGEVYPAARLPRLAKARGAFVIEVNPEESRFTGEITDLHLAERASVALPLLAARLFPEQEPPC